MPAAYVNARYALFSATELSTVDLSTATDLGAIAPGTALGEPEIATADGFGRKAAVAARQDFVIFTYGDTVEAALQAAADNNPPTGGYLYIVNASRSRADKYAVSVVSADTWGVTDEESRQRVRYQFYADSDRVQDFHDVIEGVIVMPAAS